jgi:hypothetical protein
VLKYCSFFGKKSRKEIVMSLFGLRLNIFGLLFGQNHVSFSPSDALRSPARRDLVVELLIGKCIRDKRTIPSCYDLYLEEERLVITDVELRADCLILWDARLGHVIRMRPNMQIRIVKEGLLQSRVFPQHDECSIGIGEEYFVPPPPNQCWEISFDDRDIRLLVSYSTPPSAKTPLFLGT